MHYFVFHPSPNGTHRNEKGEVGILIEVPEDTKVHTKQPILKAADGIEQIPTAELASRRAARTQPKP